MATTLQAALHANAPRYGQQHVTARPLLIHGAVALLFALLVVRGLAGGGLAGWSAGLVYIAYDTALLVFTFRQTLGLPAAQATARAADAPPLAVIVAAYNEADSLAATIAALAAQTCKPASIVVADDGSSDATTDLFRVRYGLEPPALGTLSPPSPVLAALRWLRLPHGGKAAALNAALLAVDTPLVVSVDADTILEPAALAAMAAAFAADENLVAATGVLTPVCGAGATASLLEWFQTYEYIRNFLSRYAWMRLNALLLISGAFAGFRRDAVIAVGGFDPDCLVEDYELIHRLRRGGTAAGRRWTTAVLGGARATTAAPASVPAFLRQRRRWFGGFLQTQYWYRDMVGDPRYGRLGTAMLPIKAADTMQPLYGLFAFALLLDYIFTGRLHVLLPVGGLILGKIALDLAFHVWSVGRYRRWTGGTVRARLPEALLAALLEPFTFQLLRHAGAAWGWASVLSGRAGVWGKSRARGGNGG